MQRPWCGCLWAGRRLQSDWQNYSVRKIFGHNCGGECVRRKMLVRFEVFATSGSCLCVFRAHADGHKLKVIPFFCGHGIGEYFHGLPSILHFGEFRALYLSRVCKIFACKENRRMSLCALATEAIETLETALAQVPTQHPVIIDHFALFQRIISPEL